MDEKNTNAKIKPSRMKYIGVWMLCGIINNILMTILDNILADAIVSDLGDLNLYFMVNAFGMILIIPVVFILVYNAFSTLNMKKVMPYVYILGGLGFLYNIGQMNSLYKPLGVDLTFFYIVFTAAFFCIVYSIRYYFVGNPNRWY